MAWPVGPAILSLARCARSRFLSQRPHKGRLPRLDGGLRSQACKAWREWAGATMRPYWRARHPAPARLPAQPAGCVQPRRPLCRAVQSFRDCTPMRPAGTLHWRPVCRAATPLSPLPPVAPGKPRVVALAGDSMMAVGISATLLRQAATDKNLRIVKAFRSGTGLARPEVFNWMDEYPAMLGAEKPDVVIVAMGANDGQGFVVQGKVLAFGSDGWRKVYQDRLAAYLAMVAAGGARVVWLGLPPMRVPVYDEKIA